MYADTSQRHHRETAALARALHWSAARQHLATEIPTQLRPWLLAEGSLTQHLVAASAGTFRVERVMQEWQRPTLSEARLLQIDPSQYALIREVILWGRGQPWVYARSVIPARSLRGDLRRLRKLRNSSLGALLFSYPQLQREPFELAAIDARALPVPLRADSTLWARRSRFSVDDRTLIVGEIFLAGFVQTLAHSPKLTRLI
ncbi:MAG TPA: chorismate lyase [Spongiibacteraceae bacterium]|nr:chorismate lyase [Spongiibacteraceae bacterium]